MRWLRCGLKGEARMTHKTTMEIRKFSKDQNESDSLLALMDYYHVTNLMNISEEQGLVFLDLLKREEVRLY